MSRYGKVTTPMGTQLQGRGGGVSRRVSLILTPPRDEGPAV